MQQTMRTYNKLWHPRNNLGSSYFSLIILCLAIYYNTFVFALAPCSKEKMKNNIRRVKTLSRFMVLWEPIKRKMAEINQGNRTDGQYLHLQVPFIAQIRNPKLWYHKKLCCRLHPTWFSWRMLIRWHTQRRIYSLC